MAKVKKYNFYSNTNVNNKFLEYWQTPNLNTDDENIDYITIKNRFVNRPDLLSYFYYSTPRYYWTFKYLNPDKLKNPIYDFVAGKEIKIFKPSYLSIAL